MASIEFEPLPVIGRLAALLLSLSAENPTIVSIEGPDAAGKTTLADALAIETAKSRNVVRVQADHFLQPRRIRYQRGMASPVGYVEDSYNHDALEAVVLSPLRDGDRYVERRIFDRASDTPIREPKEHVPPDAVVIVDGAFLLSRQLRPYWTLSIVLKVQEAEILRRAQVRDSDRLGGIGGVIERYRSRYLPGYALYTEREDPESHTDILIDNTNLQSPVVLRWPPPTFVGHREDGSPRDFT
jgi:uridine kinase